MKWSTINRQTTEEERLDNILHDIQCLEIGIWCGVFVIYVVHLFVCVCLNTKIIYKKKNINIR